MSLKNIMEIFLKEPNKKHEKALLNELKNAELLAPVIMAAPLAKPDGKAFYEEEGSNIKFALLADDESGERFFPAFSSRDEMMKWRADSEQEAVPLKLKDYALLLKDSEYSGVVIDAYSHSLKLNLEFFRTLFD